VSDEQGDGFRRDIKGSGTVPCSPTAVVVGLGQGMLVPWNTSDRQNGGKKEKKIMILFVLNNELTRTRLRCSIYVVNIVSKQNKSTKHIHFH